MKLKIYEYDAGDWVEFDLLDNDEKSLLQGAGHDISIHDWIKIVTKLGVEVERIDVEACIECGQPIEECICDEDVFDPDE